MDWYRASFHIKEKDFRALKDALHSEVDPDRTIQIACHHLAIVEGGDPEEIKTRAIDLVERARAGLRALQTR